MLGAVSEDELRKELGASSLALVSQRPYIDELDVPPKLANYLACGVPVVACVPTGSEVEPLVRSSGAGFVVDPLQLDQFGFAVASALDDFEQLKAMSQKATPFARQAFSIEAVGNVFEQLIYDTMAGE